MGISGPGIRDEGVGDVVPCLGLKFIHQEFYKPALELDQGSHDSNLIS